MSLGGAPEHHRRLLADILAANEAFGLALMGGYAVRAHGLVSRPSQDLDFATGSPEPMGDIVAAVTGGLVARGWEISGVDVTALKARFVATDPVSGLACEVDLLKEALWRPPVLLDVGPVLHLDDLVATKVRALGDRGLARDLIDVYSARDRYSMADLEDLGARVPEEFDLGELRGRLESVEWISDIEIERYGLAAGEIAAIRAWAAAWHADLTRRMGVTYEDPIDE